jgi:hypothetical protein
MYPALKSATLGESVVLEAPTPKTLSIPEAGFQYLGLSKNGSYDAAARGEIPYIVVGRLKRVPIALMEKMMEQAVVSPPRESVSVAPAAKPSRYPRSAAVRRSARVPAGIT